MNEKGSVYDMFYLLSVMLVVSIVLLISVTVWYSVSTSATWNATMNTAETNATRASVNTAYSTFDSMLVVFYVMVNLAAVISAAMVRTHPVYFAASIILLVFLCMMSAIFANVYYEVASASMIAPYANNYSLLYNVFLYMPYLSILFGGLLAIVTWGKTSTGGQYAY